jgi:hypothetical protein
MALTLPVWSRASTRLSTVCWSVLVRSDAATPNDAFVVNSVVPVGTCEFAGRWRDAGTRRDRQRPLRSASCRSPVSCGLPDDLRESSDIWLFADIGYSDGDVLDDVLTWTRVVIDLSTPCRGRSAMSTARDSRRLLLFGGLTYSELEKDLYTLTVGTAADLFPAATQSLLPPSIVIAFA